MTTIREIESDKKINITAAKFSCDDEDTSIPNPLPRKGGFAMLITGKPGSGKSTLLLSLLCKSGKAFNRKFDRVYLFSPSLATMSDDPFELIPDDQKFTDVTIENLEFVLSEIEDSSEKVLLVLDDCIADIRGKGKGLIENKLHKIFFNRRHLCGAGGSCSIMATSQSYNKIDPKLRKTASHCIFYKNLNKKEQDSIFDEIILIPRKEYADVCKYVYDKKHQFMFIDTNQNPDNMLYKNFNQLEVSSDNIVSY